MMAYELVTVPARESWTTVAQGGDWVVVIEYHDGQWSCPVPELQEPARPVGADGQDSEGRRSLAVRGCRRVPGCRRASRVPGRGGP